MKHGWRVDRGGAARTSSDPSPGLGTVRAVVGLDFVLFGLIFPILPLYARHLGMSVVTIGLMLGAYSAAQLVTAPLWGRLADAKGRRSVLIVALSGSALSAIGLAFATSSTVLDFAVIVNGASGGSMAIAQAAIADITHHEQHAREFGLLGAYVAMGFVVGPGLAAASALGGIRLPFIVAAVLGCINLVFAIARFPETRTDSRAEKAQPATVVHVKRSTRWQCLVTLGLGVFAFSAFESTFGLVGRKNLGFGATGVALSFVLLGVVLAATEGGAIAPVLRRYGASTTVAIGAVGLAGGLVTIGLSRDVPMMVLGLLLLGVGYGLISPVLTSAVVQSSPEDRRAGTLGWQQSVSSVARIFGPAVGAGLLAGIGPSSDYLIVAFVALLVLGALASRRYREVLGLVQSSPRFSDVAP